MTDKYFDNYKKEKAIDWLKDKWPKDRSCECCSASNWIVADDLIVPPNLIKEGVISSTGSLYPFILLVCSNCGNSKLFNAVIIGIVKSMDEHKEIEVSKEDEKKDTCKKDNEHKYLFMKCLHRWFRG